MYTTQDIMNMMQRKIAQDKKHKANKPKNGKGK